MNFLSFLVFIVLQILFLPISLTGVLLILYKQLVVSRRIGVSQTGIEVLKGRWTMQWFGIRQDKVADKLMWSLPNTSPVGLALFLFPLWVKYKISGRYFFYPQIPRKGEERMADVIVARTLCFDRIIESHVEDTEQFVVLGAGYDTRAYGELQNRGFTFFELDQPRTQQLKVDALRKAGIDASHVNFVPVDFNQENAFEKLRSSSFDPKKRTIFLWEGVTLYLSEADVRRTLQAVKRHSSPESVIVADFYGERMIRAGSGSLTKTTLAYTNEEFGFGLPFETNYERTLKDFLDSAGLKLAHAHFLGKASPLGPFIAVAEIDV
jgi:methyltransferase (TIGR00027 family)